MERSVHIFLVNKDHLFTLELMPDERFKTIRHHQRRRIAGRDAIDRRDQRDFFLLDVVVRFDPRIVQKHHQSSR